MNEQQDLRTRLSTTRWPASAAVVAVPHAETGLDYTFVIVVAT